MFALKEEPGAGPPGPGEATVKCLILALSTTLSVVVREDGPWTCTSLQTSLHSLTPSLDPTAPTSPSFPEGHSPERVGGRQELWALPILPALLLPCPWRLKPHRVRLC